MEENNNATDTNVGRIENSIEETIKQLELILKVRKGQKEIIECAGGSCINCNPDIKALTESIDILSDYKRVLEINEVLLKENEELKIKEFQLHLATEEMKSMIYKQKVKDKIEKEIKYHERNILEIENITMLKSKTAKEEAEIEFNKYAIVVLKKILQELIKEEEENHEENI